MHPRRMQCDACHPGSLSQRFVRLVCKETVAEIVAPSDADEIANDDLLISMLISLAPKKIIVENKEKIKNEQLFETIEKVFLNVEYKISGNK